MSDRPVVTDVGLADTLLMPDDATVVVRIREGATLEEKFAYLLRQAERGERVQNEHATRLTEIEGVTSRHALRHLRLHECPRRSRVKAGVRG